MRNCNNIIGELYGAIERCNLFILNKMLRGTFLTWFQEPTISDISANQYHIFQLLDIRLLLIFLSLLCVVILFHLQGNNSSASLFPLIFYNNYILFLVVVSFSNNGYEAQGCQIIKRICAQRCTGVKLPFETGYFYR